MPAIALSMRGSFLDYHTVLIMQYRMWDISILDCISMEITGLPLVAPYALLLAILHPADNHHQQYIR